MPTNLTASSHSPAGSLCKTGRSCSIGGIQIALLTVALSVTLPLSAQDLGPATDLGTLGGPSSEASALNNAGTIVGQARNANAASRIRDVRASYHGFARPPGRPLIDIDPAAVHSRPVAVNADGIVAAALGASNGQITGSVSWREGAGQSGLTPPSGYFRPAAVDIDDGGNILLNANAESGTDVAFLYNIGGRRWTRLPCSASCTVSAQNERGDIVGYLPLTSEPVRWRTNSNVIEKLPVPRGVRDLIPSDINDRGTIAGTGRGDDDQSVIVVWTGPNHVARVLGKGAAHAINNQDVVAGSHGFRDAFGSDAQLPQIWDLKSNDRATELRGLENERVKGVATDINDRGVVVGTIVAGDDEDATRAVVWGERRTATQAGSGPRSGGGGPRVVGVTRD